MKQAILIILLLTPTISQAERFIPKEAEPYVEQFERLSGKPIFNLEIIFNYGPMTPPGELPNVDKDYATIGYCTMKPGYIPTIVIDKWWWDKASVGKRVQLMFHEMGHCVLKRGHDDSVTKEGIPTSLMHSTIISQPIVDKHLQYYLKELFKKENYNGILKFKSY